MGKKDLFEDNIKCPHCNKGVHIKIEKETVEPGIPAVTKLNVFIDKSVQTKLK